MYRSELLLNLPYRSERETIKQRTRINQAAIVELDSDEQSESEEEGEDDQQHDEEGGEDGEVGDLHREGAQDKESRGLRQTFNSVLSKLSLAKENSSDTSTVSKSVAGTLERKLKGLSRMGSNISLNLDNLDKTRKKTFMFFTSQGEKGFIISDEDEFTGIIEIQGNKVQKKRKSKKKQTHNFCLPGEEQQPLIAMVEGD